MTPATNSSNPRSHQRGPGRPRRYQQSIEVLPGATRFSDDSQMQNPLWVIKRFKEHPQFCRPLIAG